MARQQEQNTQAQGTPAHQAASAKASETPDPDTTTDTEELDGAGDVPDDPDKLDDDFFSDGDDDDDAGEEEEEAAAGGEGDGKAKAPEDEPKKGEAEGDEGESDPQDPATGDEAGPAAEPDKQNPLKKIEQLGYELSNLKAKIEGQAEGKATTTDAAKVDELLQELTTLQTALAEGEEYEFLDKASARKLLGLVGKTLEKGNRLEAELGELGKDVAARKAHDEEGRYWAALESEHPHLSGGKGRTLFTETEKAVAAKGYAKGTPEYTGALQFAWDQALEKAATDAAARKAPPPTPDPKKKPAEPSTTPAKSTEGAVVKPRGASADAPPASLPEDDEALSDDFFRD